MSESSPDILEHTNIGFGEYQGRTWAEVARTDPSYIRRWLETVDLSKIDARLLAALRKESMGDNQKPETQSDRGHGGGIPPRSAGWRAPQPWNRGERTRTVRNDVLVPMPTEWSEYGHRPNYFAQYVTIGAMPSVLMENWPLLLDDFDSASHASLQKWSPITALQRVLSQSVFLIRENRPQNRHEESRYAAHIVEKILKRGITPWPTLGVEREALELNGPFDFVRELDANHDEEGWESNMNVRVPEVLSAILERDNFELDPSFEYSIYREDSTIASWAESKFLDKWVPEHLGVSAGHWFTPQAPLGKIMESSGTTQSTNDHRRIDFMFYHPLRPRPLAVEIDGPQHDEATGVDAERDQSLPSYFDVIRIPTEELRIGSGPNLTHLQEILSDLFVPGDLPSTLTKRIADFTLDCSIAAKVQLAVTGAIWRGWLRPSRSWKITITGARKPSEAGVVDLLEMIQALDEIYGISVSPSCCTVELESGATKYWPNAEVTDETPSEPYASVGAPDHLSIVVELARGPYHRVRSENAPDYIIRSAYLPASIDSNPEVPGTVRSSRASLGDSDKSPVHSAVKTFLRHIYRKREFREGQARAILNALKHIDTIVLLPTGGGKSIIYQLAGFLMPGVTLVVDPIIALMHDQIEGLQSYGIDRAIAIYSEERSAQERKIRLVENGHCHFAFLSPERLQSPRFRLAIHGLAETFPINMAVIDEAHCVSEWGHEFRPAYLSLANSLRGLTSPIMQDRPPTIIAMTGTASRAVLRDMLNDLEIDKENSDSLIRPESFDRKEITFNVVQTTPELASAKLKAVLRRLPAEAGMPGSEYYKARGRRTNSGIVFVPTVGGNTGIDAAMQDVRDATSADITCYSGTAPRSFEILGEDQEWNHTKRGNARAFKSNIAPVLVATKAYGMGIDKPNIRYTIHYGLPHSLEQYYQEAGRAGRDRHEAQSTLIFRELSQERSNQLLNLDLELQQLKVMSQEAGKDYAARDDVTTALYFHTKSFPGTDEEIRDIEDLLRHIVDRLPEIPLTLPFEDKQSSKEKAIYRLYRLGFVKDYTVDYGSKKFSITTIPYNIALCQNRLIEYVRAVAPGKLGSIRRELKQVEQSDADNKQRALVGLSTILVEFAYDEIERARRRAIQEVVLLARQSKSDADVRRRLLDYLQEGVGFERIDELIQREQVDLNEWVDLVDKIGNPIEAGALRGLCIRALESSPDHPGLLLIRGVIEPLTSDYYWNVATSNISRAVLVGIEKYDVSVDHFENVFGRLFSSFTIDDDPSTSMQTKRRKLERALVFTLFFDLAGTHVEEFATRIALHNVAQSSEYKTLSVSNVFRIEKLIRQLDESARAIIQELKRSKI